MIEVKRKLVTVDKVLAGLDAIHLDVQNKFHDQWDWMNAAFYVEILRSALASKDAEIRVLREALRLSTEDHEIWAEHYSVDWLIGEAQVRLATAPEGEKS